MNKRHNNNCTSNRECFANNSKSMPTWAIVLIIVCVMLLVISCVIANIHYNYNSNSTGIDSSIALGSFLGSMSF